jgi:hypothetical protein
VGRILVDVDRNRDHLAGTAGGSGNPSIVADALDWVTGEGFAETMSFLTGGRFEYGSAQHYRERYASQTIPALVKAGLLHRH